MNCMLVAVVSLFSLAAAGPAWTAEAPARNSAATAAAPARKRIQQALKQNDGPAPLKEAAADVLRLVPDNVFVREALENAVAAASEGPEEKAAAALRGGLREAEAVLAFTPVREAKLPAGFPEPTPVGEIQVKSYPAYRLARAAMDGSEGEGQAFLTLFEHITRNSIAMTAPVELTYAAGNGQAPRGQAMAFLYENVELGKPGADGKVQVVDVPALTAVSLGVRGDYRAERVADARARLESWLKGHADRYEAAGPLRVLGYNSPMIPAERRYAEVQLPVRLKAAER